MNREAPSLSGHMRESPLYSIMSTGLTDRVFLIGHADGFDIGDVYQVNSVQEAVNRMGADSNSPLLRGLLEAYYSGARDIWLMCAGPMSEYVSEVADRLTPVSGQTYYQRYYDRLTSAYTLLTEWEIPQIIVPLETSVYNTGGVDFLTQLTEHCALAFSITGVIRLGIIGTRGVLDDTVITALLADSRFANMSEEGKFVLVAAGDAVMNLRELPTTYAASPCASLAGELSSLRLDRGLTYHHMKNAISTTHRDLTKATIEQLAQAKINPLVRTTRGKRGTPFQVVLATDNTLGQEGTDYWSLTQVRVVAKVLDRLRAIGKLYIGETNYADMRGKMIDYLAALQSQDYIREFGLDVSTQWRTAQIINGVTVDVPAYQTVVVNCMLKPYFGIRTITFQVEIGPSN